MKIQAVRGMHDILPQESWIWRRVEEILIDELTRYGYFEIRLPVVERTELFERSLGEVTDIVEKEMYTFEDRSGERLTLRPEGTAGCLRACLEHGLLHHMPALRLWYLGPMFRHERPQKGRYRQFHQLGVEAYGMEGPDIDAELIALGQRFWKRLGIAEKLRLEINTLGTPEERRRYREHLVTYFERHKAQLDADSLRRLYTNPLRILDSKNPDLKPVIEKAPILYDFLGETSRNHFERFRNLLDGLGIPYTVNPHLVRGLDYYSRTVFEWITSELGAQGAICAGGRYDGLIEQFGGKPMPAVGFALGMERLIALIDPEALFEREAPHLYFIHVGPRAEREGLKLAERLRDALPDLRLLFHCGGGSMKAQFKKADRSGARYALILGDEELVRGVVALKPLREEGRQEEIPISHLVEALRTKLGL